MVASGGTLAGAYGGDDNDYVYGGAGSDIIYGGDGVDVLQGAGGDVYWGGQGVNYLVLGGGNDTVGGNPFLGGIDVICNFDPAHDVLYLQSTGLFSVDDVVARTSDYIASGGFSIITIGPDTAVWLIGVSPSQLNSQDIHFQVR